MKQQLRIALAAALLCAAPITAAAAGTGYSDVKAGEWYYPAVSAM